MRRTAATGVVLLGVAAACSVEPVPDGPADAAVGVDTMAAPRQHDGTLVSFVCDDMFRFTVRFEGDSATLFLPDSTLALERTPAASGARYARAGVEFWQRGEEAMLDVDGTLYSACQTHEGGDPFVTARLRGVAFRAIGQEPGWYLEIEPDGMIVFVGDYGDRTMETPVPVPAREGSRTEYHAVTGAGELRVLIDAAPCTDIMSGEAFSATVIVTVAGDEYRGCGRWLGGTRGR
jgi:putative lipoprotein